MKILYAIQGTGNGHLSRARDIIPLLRQNHEVDILVSGIQADVELPYPVRYKFKGLSFIFGKRGGIDLLGTYRKSHLKRLYKEIKSLPILEYDLVLNDFEPVSAWACKMMHKECVGLSHQAAVINKKSPRPKKSDPVGKAILNNYAPVDVAYGFHFCEYDANIFTPVIRSQVRHASPRYEGYYAVYLPSYDDMRIIGILAEIPEIEWRVFSKHSTHTYRDRNVSVEPISNDAFVESLVNCTGILCGAGFETPAEALFLKKKLLVIPMKGQYEQQCNAAALAEMGVPVIKKLKAKHIQKIRDWINNEQHIEVNYPDVTKTILDEVISRHSQPSPIAYPVLGQSLYSAKKLKERSLGKIIKDISR